MPAGDSSVIVAATGAQGAAGYSSCGGFGAVVKATLSVTPGETLYVEVGGLGSNGEGSGGAGGGNGGGASDVRTLPVAQGLASIQSRLVVAGGGGGGGDGTELGSTGCGGNAGSAPASGLGAFSIGGGGPGGSSSGARPVTRMATVQRLRRAVWASVARVAVRNATAVVGVAVATTAVAAGSSRRDDWRRWRRRFELCSRLRDWHIGDHHVGGERHGDAQLHRRTADGNCPRADRRRELHAGTIGQHVVLMRRGRGRPRNQLVR